MKISLLTFITLLFAPTLADACSVPVFRYALERWDLAKYEITVFYERALPADLEKSLKSLEADLKQANITITRVDLKGKVAPEYVKQWAMQTERKTLPWLSARLPDTNAKLPDAWAGPFTEANLRGVLDSPVRQRLVKQLSQGSTAVFLLLPGHDAAANAKAAELLDKELARLTKIVQLPAASNEGPQIRTGVPLKIEFVTIKLDRSDAAEQAFIQSLLNSEEDLTKVRGPIVLPVFGRGRLLCSLFGDDLNRDQIANVVRFLCGECSCQVKELNPGVDLLIAANWLDILEKSGPPLSPQQAKHPPLVAETKSQAPLAAPTEVTPIAAPTPVEPQATTTPSVVVPPSISATSQAVASDSCPISMMAHHCWLLAAIGGAGVLVLVTGIWAFSGRAERRKPPG